MNLLQAIESRLPPGHRLGERLGTGATSWVYVIEDESGRPDLVIKVLHPGILKRESVERFMREIALMQKLAHPRVIPILDNGEAGGALYFTMPFRGRETVRMRLDSAGPFSVRHTLLVARDIVEALGYAHKQGVVHRDVKPENILLDASERGGAYLMDFGFANAPSMMSVAESSTDAGLVIGTPGYLSPEQISGRRADDWRSDLYSLGCVMFEMLTGRLPSPRGNSVAAMMQALAQPIPDVRSIRPDVPDDVAGIVRRNLAFHPNDRFMTAFHLQMSIESALEQPENGQMVNAR